MSKYKFWNKQDPICFLTGRMLTAEQFIADKPVFGLDSIKVVVNGEGLNGAFIQEFSSLKATYAQAGCSFEGLTDEEALDAIEAFENQLNELAQEPTAEERIAAALEYQNLENM